MREKYKENMDKKYGNGTWDKMVVASKQTASWGPLVLKNNIDYYTQKVSELKSEKGMV